MNTETIQNTPPTTTLSANLNSINTNKGTTNSNNNIINWENNSYDNYVKKLSNEYLEADRNYQKHLSTDWTGALPNIWPFTMFTKPKKEKMNQIKNERDILFANLQNAKTQQADYYSNLQAQKLKYQIEQEGLKRIGINNPYFMLKNGPIQGNVNLTSNTKTQSYNPKYENNKGKNLWDFLGGKGNKKSKGDIEQLIKLLPLLLGAI